MSFTDEYTIDDETQKESLSLTDEVGATLPPPPIATARAEKVDYALGARSPGVPELSSAIAAGGENMLRKQLAFEEDIKYRQTKMDILATVARTQGRDLSQDEVSIIQSLTQHDIQTDPSKVLERKFADKYVSDVTAYGRQQMDQYFNEKERERDNASEIIANNQYFQKRKDDFDAKWQETVGWGEAIIDYAWQMVPATTWWYMNNALADKPGVTILLGKTMRDNIQSLYSLPFEQRRAKYEEAMEYLWQKNPLDAQLFAQAMVSFGTSDEYIANSVTLADFGSIGSFFGKGAARLAGRRGAAEATKAKPGSLVDDAVRQAEAASEPSPQAPYKQPPEQVQLDLFGKRPDQGSFRFMEMTPGQTTPSLESKPPPGKLRATHELPGEPRYPARDPVTGKMMRRPQQLSMDLPEVSHQFSLDMAAPRPVQEVRQVMGDAIKATEGRKMDPESIMSGTGHIEEAGILGALRRFATPFTGGLEDLAREIPTFANPMAFLRDSKVLGREYAQRLGPALAKQGNELVSAFLNSVRGSRITAEALAVGRGVAEAALKGEYLHRPRFSDGFVNFSFVPAEMHPSNVDTVVMKLGKTTATGFDSAEQAALYRKDIYQLGDKEAMITRQGDAWFLDIPKHIDETGDMVRDVWSPKNANPGGLWNSLINRLRSTEDLLSPFQREQRKVATHGQQELRKQIRDIIKDDIEGIGKLERREVHDMLKINRDMPSKRFPGERGDWYDTAGQFEQAFVERHGKLPTEGQIKAYDTYKRLSDFDWLLRNVAVYRDKARQGVETFRYRFGKDGAIELSPWFEGKQHTSMPWSIGKKGDQDAGIWIWDSASQTGKFHYKFDMDDQLRKSIDKMVTEDGYRVIQVFDPKKHPLEGFAKTASGTNLKDQVNYVITNVWEKQPLQWKQVDYRPGGHVLYPHKWYVAQALLGEGRLGKMTYFGDNVALNVVTEEQARMWAGRLDEARLLLKAGKSDALDAFLAKNLPYDRKTFEELFFRKDSPFSLDHRVTFKEAGNTTLETTPELKALYDRGDLVDSTRNIHDLSNFMDKAFLQDRDLILNTIDEKAMRLVAAEQVDPFAALNKAMGQSLRNVWMNDYKIGAVEEWLKNFKGVMKPNESVLSSFPSYFLHRPQWADVASNQFAELASAKATQRAIVNFIGTQTELGSALSAVQTKLMNSVYKTAGVDAAAKFDTLSALADPVTFLRGVAFHSKLGLFNPVQLWLQAQSMAHSIAVAGPKAGLSGVAGYMGMRYVAHNPEMLDTVAKMMAKTGAFTVPEFKELYEVMRKTGVFQVAGEATLRDDMFDPKLFRSTAGWILDGGTWFFNEGERATRLTAFATAFKEFKLANKGAKIGNREIGEIMNRSDLLSVNMTRASNAAWQSGPLAVPTQFFAFNARLTEQMLGSRLTGVEKLRAFTTYSAMYGVPVGIGAGVGLWPIYDSLREEAHQRGIDLSPAYMEAMSQGLLGMGLHYATGKEYNLAQRVGPGNNTQLRDMVNGDKTAAEISLGASGTIIGDIIKTMNPFRYYAASVFSETGEYPVVASDWMNLLRNITTADIAAKVLAIQSYGKWITKTGTVVGKADGMDAAMAVLGLTPMHIADTYMIQKANEDERKGAASLEKDAFDNFRRGLQSGANGDSKLMESYFKRAYTSMQAGDFSFSDQKRIYHKALGAMNDLEDKVNWDSVRKAPASKYEDRLEAFGRKQRKQEQ